MTQCHHPARKRLMACLAATGSGNHFPGDFSPQVIPYHRAKGDTGVSFLSLQSSQPTHGSQAAWPGGSCLGRAETSCVRGQSRDWAGQTQRVTHAFLHWLSTWQRALNSDHRGGQAGPLLLYSQQRDPGQANDTPRGQLSCTDKKCL